MSTLSCQLLVCSSALTEDIYRTFLRKNAGQTELVWVGRAMVLAIALVAIAIGSNPESSVLGMVRYAWAGFGAAFGPVIILSLFWPAMTRNGALAGILVGAVTVVVWKQGGWLGLYEIIPGLIFASLATCVVSRMGQASSSMRSHHRAVKTELRTALAYRALAPRLCNAGSGTRTGCKARFLRPVAIACRLAPGPKPPHQFALHLCR